MIGIIDYGAGNTRSVQNALARMGVPYGLSDQKSVLASCEKIIFPGVGSAQSAMETLAEKDLISWIQNCQKPFLGICLGMQLLFESSAEGNGSTPALGIIPGKIKKFKGGKKVPHMGWNQISAEKIPAFQHEYFYFVHSYCAPVSKFTQATCHYHDETFAAVVRKDNFWGAQFHPEKSGKRGQDFLKCFLESTTV